MMFKTRDVTPQMMFKNTLNDVQDKGYHHQQTPLSRHSYTHQGSGRGAARAEDAPGTPTQSHISPSMIKCLKVALERRVVTTSRLASFDTPARSVTPFYFE